MSSDWQIAINARLNWLKTARPNQIPLDTEGKLYHIWLAGRGFGKTRTAVEDMWWDCWINPGIRYAVVCATLSDTRKTAFDGESGLTACCPYELIEDYNKALLEIKLINGSIIQGYTAEEPQRLRGPQFHRAWADELAAWRYSQETWDMLQFCLRLGNKPKVNITTTPKPIKLLKYLVSSEKSLLIKGSTFDNSDNLADAQLEALRERYQGTRLGRQELEGEILEDIEGALWNLSLLEHAHNLSKNVFDYDRVVIAIDPAVSCNEDSSETGIVVAAKMVNGKYLVIEDASGIYTPNEWGELAVKLYDKYQADCVVGEVNNGGDLVENNVRTHDPNINFKQVRATRGKVKRAEPIAALYEQHKVVHLKYFDDLETQMTEYTGIKTDESPDRLDALVWALTELSNKTKKEPSLRILN